MNLPRKETHLTDEADEEHDEERSIGNDEAASEDGNEVSDKKVTRKKMESMIAGRAITKKAKAALYLCVY